MRKGENKGNGIEKMLDYMRNFRHFKDKTDEEKKMLLCQSKNTRLVDMFITNDEDRIACYQVIYKDNQEEFLKCLFNILMNTVNESLKYKYVSLFEDEEVKKKIVLSIDNLFLRGLALEYLNPSNQDEVILTIPDDENLKEIYFSTNNVKVLCAIKDDLSKEIFMKTLPYFLQAEVISSFSDDKHKYYFTRQLEFEPYLIQIVNSIEDFRYKKAAFCEHDDLNFKLMVIRDIEDLQEFNELVGLLPESIYKELFYISRKENKQEILKQYQLDKVEVDSNSGLTFKIAFDLDISLAPELADFTGIFNNWVTERDKYVPNIYHVTSPKLDYSVDGFKEVKFMCDLFKKYQCFPIYGSNMSIKYGFNYFKSFGEFVNFIKMYACLEDVLKKICNRGGVDGTNSSILSFELLLRYLVAKGVKITDYSSIKTFLKDMNKFTDSKNYSLHFLNCGRGDNMLEFKMTNNEIDFEELKSSIILLAKLMEKARLVTMLLDKCQAIGDGDNKKVNKINLLLLLDCLCEDKGVKEIINTFRNDNLQSVMVDFIQILKHECSEEQKLESLLSLLFDTEEERNVYRNRYAANNKNKTYTRG